MSQSASANPASGPRSLWWMAVATVFVLGIAWFLRWASPSVVPFRLDEAITAVYATRIAEGHEFPLTGVRTSFGFRNPPQFFYLNAPLFLLSADPQNTVWFLALLGTLGAALAGLVAGRIAGASAGLITLALVAFSPNAIEHSRRLWGHDWIVPLTALTCYLAFRAWHSERRRLPWLIGSAAAALLAQTLHLSGGLLLIVPAWLAFADSRRMGLRWSASCAGVAVLFWLPWIVENLRDPSDFRALWGTLTHGTALHVPHVVPPLFAWATILGDSLHDNLYPRGLTIELHEASGSGVFFHPAWIIATNALGVFAFGGGVLRTVLRFRSSHPLVQACLALVLGIGFAFGVLFRGAAVPAYFLPTLVPAAILAGVAFGTVRKPPLAGTVVALAILFGTVCQNAVVDSARRGGLPTYGALRKTVATIGRANPIGAGDSPESCFVWQDGRRADSGPDVAVLWMWIVELGGTRIPVPARQTDRPVYVLLEPHARLPQAVAAILWRVPAMGNERIRCSGPGMSHEVVRLDGDAARRYLKACGFP